MKAFATRTSTFRPTFFSYCTKEWKHLNHAFKKKKKSEFDSIQKFQKG